MCVRCCSFQWAREIFRFSFNFYRLVLLNSLKSECKTNRKVNIEEICRNNGFVLLVFGCAFRRWLLFSGLGFSNPISTSEHIYIAAQSSKLAVVVVVVKGGGLKGSKKGRQRRLLLPPECKRDDFGFEFEKSNGFMQRFLWLRRRTFVGLFLQALHQYVLGTLKSLPIDPVLRDYP